MSKQKNNCTQCDFKAKTASGLKTHARSKHRGGTQRHQSFDLDIKTPEQADELVAHMVQLQASTGWVLLKQIMLGNISVLESAIIDKIDPQTGNALTEENLDIARNKRGIMKEMVEKPQALIDLFKRQTGVPVETYDPYAVDVRQFSKNSNVGDPVARTLQ